MSGARDIRAYAELSFWTRVSSTSFVHTVDEEISLVEYFNGQFTARYHEMEASGKISERFKNIKHIINEIDGHHPNPGKDAVRDREALLSFIRACQVGGAVFIELQKPYTWIEKRRWTPYDKYTRRVEPLANEIIRVNDCVAASNVNSQPHA